MKFAKSHRKTTGDVPPHHNERRVSTLQSKRGQKTSTLAFWKSLVFSDLFIPVSRKNSGRNNNVLTISAQDGLINQLDYYNHQYASADTSEYTLLKKGEFAYNKSYSGEYPFGAIKRLEKYEWGVVSPLYLCFAPKEGVNADFFAHYFTGGMMNRAIYQIAQEGARNHGLLNVPTEAFFSSQIIVPPLSEQCRIATILSACDRVVEGKQKLLEAKKQRKRALMRMLLEQENESASQNASPGKWPRIPFEDCFKLLRNNTYSRAFMVPTEGVANIHYGDVLVKYGELLDIAAGDVVSLAVGTPPNGDFLQEGDVVIADTAEDETCGKAVEIGRLGSRKAVAGLHTIACRPKRGLFVAGWLGFFLNSAAYHRQLVPLMAGIKVLSLARSSLQTTKIGVPPLAEQRRIVAILSAAGREIAGLAREVEAWKEKKKALSQLLLSGKVRV